MGKRDIEHACGHVQTHYLYKRMTERQRKEDWLKTTLCTDCYRDEQRKEALAQVADLDLPTLTGSEKQIRWADTLRAGRVIETRKYVDETLTSKYKVRDRDLTVAMLVGLLTASSASKWWIDNRDTDIGKLLNDLVRASAAAVQPDAEALRELIAPGGVIAMPALVGVWYEALRIVSFVVSEEALLSLRGAVERLWRAFKEAPPPTPGEAGIRFIPRLLGEGQMRYHDRRDPSFAARLLAALAGLDMPLPGSAGDELRTAAVNLSVMLRFDAADASDST